MLLNTIGRLGQQLGEVGGSAMTGAASAVLEKLGKTPEMLDSFLKSAVERLTPITVVVDCIPTGPGADDYRLDIDHLEFDAAVNAGRLVRPQLVVKATRNDMNRDLLTERMLESMTPILSAYEDDVFSERVKKGFEHFSQNVSLGFDLFGIFNALLFLCLIGAGALVGPIFWLLIGLGGVAALAQVPELIVDTAKHVLFGTKIDQLERKLAQAREVLRHMVKDMRIELYS